MATYTAVNATTYAGITATNNSKEQKWMLRVDAESRGKNPFTNLTSGFRGGKPIIEVMDTRKLAGDTIIITTESPLAGPGVQGDNTRAGNEEPLRFNNYSFTIGMMFNAVARTKIAKNQTVIGSNFDRQANSKLGEWLGWKKGQDIEVSLIVAAHARNTIRPNSKATRELLRTADYVQGETISRAATTLSTLMGKGLVVGKSSAGQNIEKYLYLGNQYALKAFKQSSIYTSITSNAGVRGDSNVLFAGGLPDWNGQMLYEWEIKDHTGFGPLGAPGVARALLGVAITAGNDAQVVYGSGDTTGAALTAPLYFQHFSNAAYIGFEGVKRAADLATERYFLIQNLTGSDAMKFGFYAYTVNNGNAITPTKRLRSADSHAGANIAYQTVGNVTWGTAPWTTTYLTDAHPQGSLIYETNSYGVAFTYSYMLADEALISGYGTSDGQVAMGNRVSEEQDYTRVKGIGIEAVWGCKAIPRADGIAGGFVLIESAFKIDGQPDIT